MNTNFKEELISELKAKYDKLDNVTKEAYILFTSNINTCTADMIQLLIDMIDIELCCSTNEIYTLKDKRIIKEDYKVYCEEKGLSYPKFRKGTMYVNITKDLKEFLSEYRKDLINPTHGVVLYDRVKKHFLDDSNIYYTNSSVAYAKRLFGCQALLMIPAQRTVIKEFSLLYELPVCKPNQYIVLINELGRFYRKTMSGSISGITNDILLATHVQDYSSQELKSLSSMWTKALLIESTISDMYLKRVNSELDVNTDTAYLNVSIGSNGIAFNKNDTVEVEMKDDKYYLHGTNTSVDYIDDWSVTISDRTYVKDTLEARSVISAYMLNMSVYLIGPEVLVLPEEVQAPLTYKRLGYTNIYVDQFNFQATQFKLTNFDVTSLHAVKNIDKVMEKLDEADVNYDVHEEYLLVTVKNSEIDKYIAVVLYDEATREVTACGTTLLV